MSKCLLCLRKFPLHQMVNESHVIPDCLGKFVHNSRNKWEAIAVGGKSVIDESYGPSHPQEKYTGRMEPIHSLKHQLCRECDTDKLGNLIESKICTELLDSMLHEQVRLTSVGASGVAELKNVDAGEFRIFILSIIWRLNLRNFRDVGETALNADVMENLRQIIYSYLYDELQSYPGKYPFVVFTGNKQPETEVDSNGKVEYKLKNYSSVNTFPSSPELFFLGPICVFMAIGKPFFNIAATFPPEIVKLVAPSNFSQNKQTHVHYISNNAWLTHNLLLAATVGNKVRQDLIHRLSGNLGINEDVSELLLEKEKAEVQKEFSELAGNEHNLEAYKLAFERLRKK